MKQNKQTQKQTNTNIPHVVDLDLYNIVTIMLSSLAVKAIFFVQAALRQRPTQRAPAVTFVRPTSPAAAAG
jgi:hypothetical protein